MEDKLFNFRNYIVAFILAIFCIVLGISALSNGIKAVNAGSLDYNTMEEADLKELAKVTGEVGIVYDCIAEGYTERTSYGVVTSTTTDSYYYLVECPYDSENAVMILELPAYSAEQLKMDSLLAKLYSVEDVYGLGGHEVQFSGMLIENEAEVESYAEQWFTYAGLSGVKIAPYTITCVKTDSYIPRQFICGVAFFLLLGVLVFYFVIAIKRRTPTYSTSGASSRRIDSPSQLRVEDYYGETYHSNTYSSEQYDTQSTYQSQYGTQPTQSGQTYQPQFQTQPTQSGQTYQSQFQTQPISNNRQFQSQYTGNNYGSGNYGYGNNLNDTSSYDNENNDNSYPHY